MTAMTMFRSTAGFVPTQAERVSHVLPLLMAVALLAATAAVSVLLSGPMH